MSGYLRDMISRQVEHISIRTRLDFPDFLPSTLLQSDQWRHFLLIIREALHNVVRHARATEVGVELTIEAGQLRLVLEDNGVGFWVNEQLSGTGLRSQQHRATVLGGQWRVESEPENGTRVSVSVPVQRSVIQ